MVVIAVPKALGIEVRGPDCLLVTSQRPRDNRLVSDLRLKDAWVSIAFDADGAPVPALHIVVKLVTFLLQ